MNASDIQTKANAYFKALFTRPEATGVAGQRHLHHERRQQDRRHRHGQREGELHGPDGRLRSDEGRRRVAWRSGATPGCASRSRSTPPARWQSDGKIDALKTATKALLDQLKAAAAKDGDVYVSIIPFSKDVNVGKANYQAPGSTGTSGTKTTATTSAPPSAPRRARRRSARRPPTGCRTTTTPGTAASPTAAPRTTRAPATTTPRPRRRRPAIVNTLFAPEQYDNCSPPIKPLSYDWTA